MPVESRIKAAESKIANLEETSSGPVARFLFSAELMGMVRGYGLSSVTRLDEGIYEFTLDNPSNMLLQVTPYHRPEPIPNAESMFCAVKWISTSKFQVANYAARLDGLVIKEAYRLSIEVH